MPAANRPAPPAKSRAKKLRDQARKAQREGRLAEAVPLLQEAWALDRDWESACDLAKIEKGLSRAPEAAASYLRCGRTMPENNGGLIGSERAGGGSGLRRSR
jgi:hypothetical protein